MIPKVSWNISKFAMQLLARRFNIDYFDIVFQKIGLLSNGDFQTVIGIFELQHVFAS